MSMSCILKDKIKEKHIKMSMKTALVDKIWESNKYNVSEQVSHRQNREISFLIIKYSYFLENNT